MIRIRAVVFRFVDQFLKNYIPFCNSLNKYSLNEIRSIINIYILAPLLEQISYSRFVFGRPKETQFPSIINVIDVKPGNNQG